MGAKKQISSMNEAVDQIKSLMKSGDISGAEALCIKAREEDQDNAAVKMLYATCRNLQGDEESFRRIMLEIAPQMEALAKADPDSEAAKLWRKSGAVLMEYVVLGVLVVAAITGTVWYFGKEVRQALTIMRQAHKYGPAPDMVRVIESQPTNIVEAASTNAVGSPNPEYFSVTNTTGAVSSEVNDAGPEDESRP